VFLRWHIKERFKVGPAGSETERFTSRSGSRVLCPQAPREDTRTFPALRISCWFAYLATQSVRCHIKIPFVDASYPTRWYGHFNI